MGSRVVSVEKKSLRFLVECVDRYRTILNIIFPVDLDVLLFSPTFEESSKDQDDDAVTNYQDLLATIVACQRTEETVHSEGNIGTALAARRTIPVLPLSLSSQRLAWVDLDDSLPSQTV